MHDPVVGLRRPRSPLSPRRGGVARFDAWFTASCPARARKALILATDGIYDFRFEPGCVMALVPSSQGGRYRVELRWGGVRLPATPRGYLPWCSCPDFRPWCKHAMALAYHMADLR